MIKHPAQLKWFRVHFALALIWHIIFLICANFSCSANYSLINLSHSEYTCPASIQVPADQPVSCVQETEACMTYQSCETREVFLGCFSYYMCGGSQRSAVCQSGHVYAARFNACLAPTKLTRDTSKWRSTCQVRPDCPEAEFSNHLWEILSYEEFLRRIFY